MATRLSHVLNMLSSDDKTAGERVSALEGLQQLKVPLVSQPDPDFIGFKRKSSSKLYTRSDGLSVSSACLDLIKQVTAQSG